MRITLLIFLFANTLIINPAFADQEEEKKLALMLLHQATNAYGEKHDICNENKKRNQLSSDTLKQLKEIQIESLRKGLMYLSEKAFNQCVQPERGLLAERLLHIQSWPEDKQTAFDRIMLLTMDSTRKLIFDISAVNTEVLFYQLPKAEQDKLLAIQAMQTPFDPMLVWGLMVPINDE
ncbi:hypothetical protein CW745_00085 [Psychromonas sp. psych-6C06]|uniref:hypothetical protein n=1 Tax=Psychromonas sp. psych-6C06 TaxID=2058089 RepID=UPI000C34040C|nr:hypothetical protein [Psychromonas sp. psych-6C06]PKF63291.1 hypothetical protein CW745_00085 [Psychromonas sp. psych-6C06]